MPAARATSTTKPRNDAAPKQPSAASVTPGALDAVLARHPGAVVRLDENLRQHDPHEGQALARLRAGDTRLAVRWYARHGRVYAGPEKPTLRRQPPGGTIGFPWCANGEDEPPWRP